MNAAESAGDCRTVKSACPTCGVVAERTVYDIGSGPELACANCEWCWGAAGQDLKPLTYYEIVKALGFDPLNRIAAQQIQAESRGEGLKRPLITLTRETTRAIGQEGVAVSLEGLDVSDDLGILQQVDVRYGDDPSIYPAVVKNISAAGMIFLDIDWSEDPAEKD